MISLIVAYTNNYVIGNKGKIPWNIPNEKKRFKELTTGNVVIMGRKTYEEIGKPLPNRITIVISSTKNFNATNCYTAKSLSEALAIFPNKDIYIAGGQKIYEEAINIVDKMYITKINDTIEGDTFFPQFDETKFNIELIETHNTIPSYTYYTYTRK